MQAVFWNLFLFSILMQLTAFSPPENAVFQFSLAIYDCLDFAPFLLVYLHSFHHALTTVSTYTAIARRPAGKAASKVTSTAATKNASAIGALPACLGIELHYKPRKIRRVN